MAIMATRANLSFESAIESDCAPLVAPVQALLAPASKSTVLRDLTRGGLATSLVELAESSNLSIAIDETAVPVTGTRPRRLRDPRLGATLRRQRRPLSSAYCPPPQADRALEIMTRTVPAPARRHRPRAAAPPAKSRSAA